MESIEAQTYFIDELYSNGQFDYDNGVSDTAAGAFFKEGDDGSNYFAVAGTDYTIIANHAWNKLRALFLENRIND